VRVLDEVAHRPSSQSFTDLGIPYESRFRAVGITPDYTLSPATLRPTRSEIRATLDAAAAFRPLQFDSGRSLWPLLSVTFIMVGMINVATHLRHW
jgi:hypothetical protein